MLCSLSLFLDLRVVVRNMKMKRNDAKALSPRIASKKYFLSRTNVSSSHILTALADNETLSSAKFPLKRKLGKKESFLSARSLPFC